MKSKLFVLAFSVVLVSTQDIACAQENTYHGTSGNVYFESDAPLELITARSSSLKGAINLENGAFAFTIDNRSFEGFNSPLQQEHFYENYIEADKFPKSTFNGKVIEPIEPGIEGEFSVRAKGILDIHGVPQERIISSSLSIDNEKVVISAVFSVMLRDHNIEVPRIVNQKIAEEIRVTVILEMFSKDGNE